jgi:hypothetical protein
MNFFGSESSSASTPASNGSSSNGFSLELDCVSSNPPSTGGASSIGAGAGAGSFEPASFSTYFSSFILEYRLFFLFYLQ